MPLASVNRGQLATLLLAIIAVAAVVGGAAAQQNTCPGKPRSPVRSVYVNGDAPGATYDTVGCFGPGCSKILSKTSVQGVKASDLLTNHGEPTEYGDHWFGEDVASQLCNKMGGVCAQDEGSCTSSTGTTQQVSECGGVVSWLYRDINGDEPGGGPWNLFCERRQSTIDDGDTSDDGGDLSTQATSCPNPNYRRCCDGRCRYRCFCYAGR